MAQNTELGWLLDDLTERVEPIRHALVLSNDGLVTGTSTGLRREDAEHLAAVSSGLHSLAKGSGRHFGAGQVRQTMIEFEDAILFVTAAGPGSCLCVLSAAESDIGQIAYEMTLMVNRVGEHLAVADREREHKPAVDL
ncbi:roadblock/LC7 domain-containing protein [Streptomyces sp. NPDC003753]|uniref:Roadblock/LC7 domain-containing protein n=1 Tax=Streptomyces cynarae TaxID=2981134 RepID=A0ABY6E9H0_9ACTN|nr:MULTISPECIES: roadblock/LC7 domain-containing protein [Streptomyces]UXY23345.1 roadblock/LC7 domain-containing protein [Streptomyces cynarae]GHK01973.1 dynein regulation protein LC7 [Streptomyces sp. Y2F8-2]